MYSNVAMDKENHGKENYQTYQTLKIIMFYFYYYVSYIHDHCKPYRNVVFYFFFHMTNIQTNQFWTCRIHFVIFQKSCSNLFMGTLILIFGKSRLISRNTKGIFCRQCGQ